MKTDQKFSNDSSKSIPEEYKSIDSAVVPVTTIKLSARTRKKQRKNVKTKNIPVEDDIESISRLASPKRRYEQPGNQTVKVSKSALKYKASKRIQSLAKPKTIIPKGSRTMSLQDSFQSTVSAKALSYVPTPRILELARPKQYLIDEDYQEDFDEDEIFI
ncbi:uncharacterized protein LOC108908772 [Anoplophora glabripennis]|uniref:uncharacterized protein LOC108908772 n=1 Tax=Anoplophora glabripennis TaxID=217634 RepID=UPI0008753CE5|nr:uncharacterized protein LOC108908772 [Anoplophora glabripennis]